MLPLHDVFVCVIIWVPTGDRVHQSQGGLHRAAADSHRHQYRDGSAPESDYARGGD